MIVTAQTQRVYEAWSEVFALDCCHDLDHSESAAVQDYGKRLLTVFIRSTHLQNSRTSEERELGIGSARVAREMLLESQSIGASDKLCKLIREAAVLIDNYEAKYESDLIQRGSFELFRREVRAYWDRWDEAQLDFDTSSVTRVLTYAFAEIGARVAEPPKQSLNPRQKLAKYYAEHGLSFHRTTGDGNCLYHGVSMGLKWQGITLSHRELRKLTVEEMQRSGAPAAEVFRHRRNGVWAENNQIVSLANALRRPILVISCHPRYPIVQRQLFLPDVPGPFDARRVLFLENYGDAHYSALSAGSDTDYAAVLEDVPEVRSCYLQ